MTPTKTSDKGATAAFGSGRNRLGIDAVGNNLDPCGGRQRAQPVRIGLGDRGHDVEALHGAPLHPGGHARAEPRPPGDGTRPLGSERLRVDELEQPA